MERAFQGLRGCSSRHLVPFQASAMVLLREFTPGWVKKPPAARQLDTFAHEIPARPRAA
jgi:hypothetical protein